MQVRVNASGSRYYIIDTKNETYETFGQGRGPSQDTVDYLMREAKRAAATGTKEITLASARDMDVPKIPKTIRVEATPSRTPQREMPDDDLMKALNERYDMFSNIVTGSTYGEFSAFVVSGGAGMGKSSLVTEAFDKARKERQVNCRIIQGSNISPINLYETLYQFREKGSVLVLDDSDPVLATSVGLLMLKAAMDTKENRVVSWGTRAALDVPPEFEFRGSIGFLTNQNLRLMCEKGNDLNERIQHLKAIVSRASYLDLMMHSNQAKWLWTVTQIKRHRILEHKGLKAQEQTDVLDFMKNNLDNLNEISIRTAVKIVPYVLMNRRDHTKDWRSAARIMEFR